MTSLRPDDRRIKNSIPGAEGYFSVRHGVQNGHGVLLRLKTFDYSRPFIAEVWERSELDLQKKSKDRGLCSGEIEKIATTLPCLKPEGSLRDHKRPLLVPLT